MLLPGHPTWADVLYIACVGIISLGFYRFLKPPSCGQGDGLRRSRLFYRTGDTVRFHLRLGHLSVTSDLALAEAGPRLEKYVCGCLACNLLE